MRLLALPAALALLGLGACGDDPVTETAATPDAEASAAPQPTETIAADNDEDTTDQGDLPQGTPLEERVATLGLLNKRNNVTETFDLKPGEERRFSDVLVRLATCEKRPPWDADPETGAFVQIFTTADREDDDPDWDRIFSGWLFLNSPSLNVVEHPIYDVWVKDCAMSFPGEEDVAKSAE